MYTNVYTKFLKIYYFILLKKKLNKKKPYQVDYGKMGSAKGVNRVYVNV